MQFRQLGRQLLEESPTVLTQLSGKLFSVIRMGSPSRFAENTSAKSELLGGLNWVLGPLTKLKANIDAVKRRSGFSAIKENYDGEEGLTGLAVDKPGSETSDSRGSISSGSQDILDENEEVKTFKFIRHRLIKRTDSLTKIFSGKNDWIHAAQSRTVNVHARTTLWDKIQHSKI